MAKVQITDKSNGQGIEVRILKEGRYNLEQVGITVEATKSRPGKNQVKLATISGKHNGKDLQIKTIDMELVESILSFSEANDTDTITLDATKQEGSRYLDWSIVF